jgi:hypothetical protein
MDPATGKPVVVLDLEQARHPCLLLAPGVESIPNTSRLGGASHSTNQVPRMLLLTGPSKEEREREREIQLNFMPTLRCTPIPSQPSVICILYSC